MPTTAADDNGDPILASYDVYFSTAEPSSLANASTTPSSKLLVLQYPAHRPNSKPYTAARSQKPSALRLKPETGLLELDIPVLTQEHYNAENGTRYQKALKDSRRSGDGGTYGLAGGFNTLHGGPGTATPELHDVPAHSSSTDSDSELDLQTLGGKITQPTTRDPVYMLGTFHGSQLHLAHLDALVQMRPQLHYLDAQDELNQQVQAVAKRKSSDPAITAPPLKLESKAIDVKLKDNKDDAKDRNLNTNARLLRNIQHEPWQVFGWTDEAEPESRKKFAETMRLKVPQDGGTEPTAQAPKRLKTAISNGEWLDKMSAPRETGHGKKGLLAKLRGRERERARRKRNDGERRARQKEAAGNTTTAATATTAAGGTSLFRDGGSDSSELSSLGSDSEASDAETRRATKGVSTKGRGNGRDKGRDVDMVDLVAGDDDVEIKEEPPGSVAAAPLAAKALPEPLDDQSGPGGNPPKSTTASIATKATPVRRGRSNKSVVHSHLDGAIELEDD